MRNRSTVGDYVSLQRGITYQGRLVGEPGPALLGLGSIQPGGGFREADYKTYGGECPDNIMLSPGDLFASLKGATKDGEMIGSVAKLPASVETGRLTQDTVKLEFHDPNERHRDFLYWVLRTPQYRAYCGGRATGSAVVALSRDDFLSFPVPEITSERLQVVELLETLHNKIELNRRMNSTLEGMAEALFKSWFVDFDPVIDNALAAGNPIPDELAPRAEVRKNAHANGTTQQGSVDHPTLSDPKSLFPAAFQFTEELGWIPEGWEVKPLSEAIQINPSVKLSKGTVAQFADMKALPTSGYSIDGVIDKEYSGGAKFQNDDVLFARITPCLENGKTGIVDFLSTPDEVGFGSTEFIVLRGKDDLTLPYVSCLARNETFRLHCKQSMVGSSGRQRVQNACFDSFHVATPTEASALEYFDNITTPMFRKSSEHGKASATLTKLRDTLLPKLISGELHILEAEQLTKEVTT